MIIRRLEALFTLRTNAAQFKKAASELDGLANKAESVMKAIAGYWAVQALQNFVANTANAMAEVGKTASHLGVTTAALQELRYAAEKSGVPVDALNDALKELQVRSVDAKSGQGEAAEAFKMLGLKSTDAVGNIREPLELLSEMADRLNALPTQSERIWIADAAFGDEGSLVLKMLKDGSSGLAAMRSEAQKLGLVLGGESITKASRFNQALKKLQIVSGGLANTFVEKLLPALSWLMEKCADLSAAFNHMEGRASLVRTTLLTLSGILGVLAVKVAFAFAPLIAIFTGIAIAAVVIDDLWVAFKGGNSVFRTLYNEAKSFFTSFKNWLSELPQAFLDWIVNGLSQGIQFIQEKFTALRNWLMGMMDALKNKVANLMPSFMQKGFSSTLRMVAGFSGQEQPQRLNTRLAPTSSNISTQNRYSSNQSVNVSVNVKSGADPRSIGGEISKVVRKELEKERFNAFMGVTQYAG